MIKAGDILGFTTRNPLSLIKLGQKIEVFDRPDIIHLAIALGNDVILEAHIFRGIRLRRLTHKDKFLVFRPVSYINNVFMLSSILGARAKFKASWAYDVSAIIGMTLRILHLPWEWLFDEDEAICSELCNIVYSDYNEWARNYHIYSQFRIGLWPADIAENKQFRKVLDKTSIL